MAAIDKLIGQISDETLRSRIQAEVGRMAKQKKFGLVFEEHLPECTPLWDIPVKKGSKAELKAGPVSEFYTVFKKPIDTVCNAPDSDLWHTLIEADNYHAPQLHQMDIGRTPVVFAADSP